MSDKKTSEVLDEAADYIDQHGWTQGTLFDHETRCVCSVGAIYIATGDYNPARALAGHHAWTGDRDAITLGEAARTALANFLGINESWSDEVPTWNDAPERTEEEVVAALRGAAEQERQKEMASV